MFLGLSSSPPLLALGFVFYARPSLEQISPSKERYQNILGLNKVKQALNSGARSLCWPRERDAEYSHQTGGPSESRRPHSSGFCRRGVEAIKRTSYPKRSTLFSIGLERKKKAEKNGFERQQTRKARKYSRDKQREQALYIYLILLIFLVLTFFEILPSTLYMLPSTLDPRQKPTLYILYC